MKTTSIDIWVVVDADGNHSVGITEDEAVEKYTDDIDGTDCTRRIKVTLNVPLPSVIEMTGDVPAERVDGAVLQVA